MREKKGGLIIKTGQNAAHPGEKWLEEPPEAPQTTEPASIGISSNNSNPPTGVDSENFQ